MLLGPLLLAACGRGKAPAPLPSPTGVRPGTSVAYGFDTEGIGPIGAPFSVLAGAWRIQAQAGAPSPPAALCHPAPASTAAAMSLPSPAYADLTLSVSIEPLAAGAGTAGLRLRVQSNGEAYLIVANAGNGSVSIGIERGTRFTPLVRQAAPVQTGQWQELSAQARGTALTAFLNGRRVAQVSDSRFARGGIGLWAGVGAAVCFDNLMATGL